MILEPCPGLCGAWVYPTTSQDVELVPFCCVPCWNQFATARGVYVGADQPLGHSEQCDIRQAGRSGPIVS